ncbi:MAG: cob(I)yrinic acid a,c-diamide adenosyltransferase [Thermoanaerobaculum sp.]|nr:cob(I)yrinic acid a,c-diamide adenosyltransferase [Thermoanaerobaculum sp.]MDW7968211.1 cob(I)yrinic acid a,c-diamide adenosyltransferase [Thermoanaerobaculum sp.]
MRVYTRTGDRGMTALGDGTRVPKWEPRVAAYGDLDEVNSWVGMLRAEGVPAEADAVLERVQRTLFSLGSVLSGSPRGFLAADAADVSWLEQWIDHMSDSLPPLNQFVLPGGCRSASVAHLCRTVTRRAERSVAALGSEGVVEVAVRFLNRLGDAFFVLARWLNRCQGAPEILWHD